METAQKKRILVIEDEVHIADGIRLNLSIQGYQVALASDGIRLGAAVPPFHRLHTSLSFYSSFCTPLAVILAARSSSEGCPCPASPHPHFLHVCRIGYTAPAMRPPQWGQDFLPLLLLLATSIFPGSYVSDMCSPLVSFPEPVFL